MKLTINTEQKTVTIDGQFTFKELEQELKARLSDEERKSFKIECTPIVVKEWHSYPVYPSYPLSPYYGTTIQLLSSNGSGCITVPCEDNLITS